MFDDSPQFTGPSPGGISSEISPASESGVIEIAQASSAGGETIGQVSATQGSAFITRTDGTKVPAADGTSIFQGDLIETQTGGAVGITFADESTFSLAENGSMVIDEMVYDPGSQSGTSTINIAQGIFTFISGQIAKTAVDAMLIKTPVATIGIRGTAGGGEAGPEGTPNTYSMFQDPTTGEVGEMTLRTNGGTTTFNSANQTSVITSKYVPPTIPVTLPPAAVAQFYSKAAATGQKTFVAPPPASASEAAAQQAAGEAFTKAITEGKSPAEAIATASDAGRKSAVEAVLADNPEAFGSEKSADSITKGQKSDILDKVAGRTGDPLDVGTGKGLSFKEGLQSQLEDPIGGLIDDETIIKDAAELAEDVGEIGPDDDLDLDFFDDIFFEEGFFEDLFFFEGFFEETFEDFLFGDGDDDFFEDAILFGFDDPFFFQDQFFFDDIFFDQSFDDPFFDPFFDDDDDFFFDPVVFGDEFDLTSETDNFLGGAGNTEFIVDQGLFGAAVYGGTGNDIIDTIDDSGGTRDRITFEGVDNVLIRMTENSGNTSRVLIDIATLTGPLNITDTTNDVLSPLSSPVNTIDITKDVEDFQALDSDFTDFDTGGVLLFGALNVTGSQAGYLVAGGTGNDVIDLSGFNDSATTLGSIIFGKGGNDTLTGTVSEDDLFGGAGLDILDGGGGLNFLNGGADDDTFNVTVASSDNIIDGGDTGTNFDTVNYNSLGVVLTVAVSSSSSIGVTHSSGADTVRGVETLNGSNNGDTYNITGDTSASSLLTIGAGSGNDTFNIGAGANVTQLLNGNLGVNTLNFADGGGTVTNVQDIGTILGGTGSDSLTFGIGNNTANISDVETINATSSSVENITLSTVALSGTTVNLSGGTDTLNLANGANVLSVSDTEDIQGGAAVDTITLIGSSVQEVTGNAGADSLTDSTTGIANTFRYAAANDGAAAGDNSGFDTITGFTTGEDTFAIAGTLETLLDDITANGSIFFGTASIDITATHEGILLTGLADADLVASGFANLLTTLNGILTTAGAGTDALIVAQGATDTGFYIYQEAGGDNAAAASELTLLAIADNEIVADTDVTVLTGGA